ncbi:hypothetical protein [Aquamicrobium soli]|jgi:hypothetical protein|uniref:DUF680 domain-containing protein n=1 Tax=Aquamicrobium soli TaxID=1811518 RepID=A0ABV7KJU7_9HYPH
MKTIALTTAALLVAAGSAFASNYRVDAAGQNPPPASVDSTYTSSVSTGSQVYINHQAAPEQAAQDHRSRWGD